jgi:hypothetical protein
VKAYNIKKEEEMGKYFVKVLSILVVSIILILSLSCSNQFDSSKKSESTKSATNRSVGSGSYNYGEALQKSIMFYEFQRSGDLDESSTRNNWRGDSGMEDGDDVGVDLTGGWYDAGDHVKFNLPMAYSATMLAWSVYEKKDAYTDSDQLDEILDNIKWATDYLIKCHPSSNVYYYQVGDGSTDHAWWGSAEVMQMDRPAAEVTTSSPGSTVVAETAAALASASIIFEDTDSSYSSECLSHAEDLFDFAEDTLSDSGYTAASGFYNSWSGFYDELSWAAIWLYMATGDSDYMDKAVYYTDYWGTEDQDGSTIAYSWGQCWDDVHYGAELLIAKETTDSDVKSNMKEAIENHLNYWINDITYTPKGLAWLSEWGSLRYATTTAYLAMIYSEWDGADSSLADECEDFAVSQVDYALGDGGRSYEIGFGDDSPEHPHHRTAHGSYADSQSVPSYHRHTLYGALVGGPDSSDDYTDSISDYVSNEVACDYNAGFTGALACMYDMYGGDPIEDFDAVEDVDDEMYVTAGINSSSSNYIEIKAYMNNVSSWPARESEALSFNYYFDLTSEFAAGYELSDITVSSNYSDGGTVTGPFVWDADEDIYYVNVDFTGTNIYPGGQSAYRKEVQFRIALPSTATEWDNSDDYSYDGIGSSSSSLNTMSTIPVYDDGELVYGEEPGDAVIDTEAPESPTGLSVTATDVDSLVIDWDDNSETDLDNYVVYQSTTSGFVPSTSNLVASPSLSTYTASDLDDDTTYYFAVLAVDNSGNESEVSTVSGTTDLYVPDTTSPSVPSDLVADSITSSSVDLSWSEVSDSDLDYYNIYRGTSENSLSLLDTSTSASYADSGLTSSSTYYYAVSAVDTSSNESDKSVSISIETEESTPVSLSLDLSYSSLIETTNSIGATFKVSNESGEDVALSNVKIRYYLTNDSSADIVFWCDYAGGPISTSWDSITDSVSGVYEDDSYVEISFSSDAGTLVDGGYAEVQSRITTSDWTSMSQSDDYSFDDASKVVILVDGVTVWGVAP